MSIKLPPLSQIFASFLNLALKTQPAMDTTPLEGRSFCLAIDELPQDIGIAIENGKVAGLGEDEAADVTISGNLKAIIRMVGNEATGLDDDELYIAGKISTARQFQHFLASFSLDWVAFFAQFMSEAQAQQTSDALTQGLHVAKGSAEHFGKSVRDYMIHDKQLLVKQAELTELRSGIDELHQRLDTLLATWG